MQSCGTFVSRAPIACAIVGNWPFAPTVTSQPEPPGGVSTPVNVNVDSAPWVAGAGSAPSVAVSCCTALDASAWSCQTHDAIPEASVCTGSDVTAGAAPPTAPTSP